MAPTPRQWPPGSASIFRIEDACSNTMTWVRAASAACVVLGLLGPALADQFAAGDLTIDSPWARATAGPAATGAVYLTLTNHGAQTDRLVATETPVAARAELHAHVMDGNVMKMRRLDAIEVAPGTPTVLAPGGLHIMLTGLTRPLKEGETFPLILTFDRTGPVEVMVEVQGLGAMGPDAGHDRGQGHGYGAMPMN